MVGVLGVNVWTPTSVGSVIPIRPTSPVCVFVTAVPITKQFVCVGGELLRETTSRGLCGLV
jgi:hypothetical protein